MPPPGEPKESPKPEPLGNFPLISLFTICTLCVLFILWRRANEIRTVVAHQLKTWTHGEGNIRLSEDDGPPSHVFVGNDDDDEDADDEPLSTRAERLRNESRSREDLTKPPTPPPKQFGIFDDGRPLV